LQGVRGGMNRHRLIPKKKITLGYNGSQEKGVVGGGGIIIQKKKKT